MIRFETSERARPSYLYLSSSIMRCIFMQWRNDRTYRPQLTEALVFVLDGSALFVASCFRTPTATPALSRRAGPASFSTPMMMAHHFETKTAHDSFSLSSRAFFPCLSCHILLPLLMMRIIIACSLLDLLHRHSIRP
jgi:hypothetical protein